MRKNLARKGAHSQSGQAVVEYILGLLMAISVISIIGLGFRSSLASLWQFFGRQISAACPGCPPDPKVKLK